MVRPRMLDLLKANIDRMYDGEVSFTSFCLLYGGHTINVSPSLSLLLYSDGSAA